MIKLINSSNYICLEVISVFCESYNTVRQTELADLARENSVEVFAIR